MRSFGGCPERDQQPLVQPVLPGRGGRVRHRRGALRATVPRRQAAGAGPASRRRSAQHLPPATAGWRRERRHHLGRLHPALSLRVRRVVHLLPAGRGACQRRQEGHRRGGRGVCWCRTRHSSRVPPASLAMTVVWTRQRGSNSTRHTRQPAAGAPAMSTQSRVRRSPRWLRPRVSRSPRSRRCSTIDATSPHDPRPGAGDAACTRLRQPAEVHRATPDHRADLPRHDRRLLLRDLPGRRGPPPPNSVSR